MLSNHNADRYRPIGLKNNFLDDLPGTFTPFSPSFSLSENISAQRESSSFATSQLNVGAYNFASLTNLPVMNLPSLNLSFNQLDLNIENSLNTTSSFLENNFQTSVASTLSNMISDTNLAFTTFTTSALTSYEFKSALTSDFTNYIPQSSNLDFEINESFDYKNKIPNEQPSEVTGNELYSAIGKGVVKEIKDVIEMIKDPVNNLIIPTGHLLAAGVRLTSDALVSREMRNHNIIADALGGPKIDENIIKSADKRMQERGVILANATQEFIEKPLLKKVEISASVGTGIFIKGFFCHGVSKAATLIKFSDASTYQFKKIFFQNKPATPISEDIIKKMGWGQTAEETQRLKSWARNSEVITIKNNTIRSRGNFDAAVMLEFDKEIFSNPVSARAYTKLKKTDLEFTLDFTAGPVLYNPGTYGTTYSMNYIPKHVVINVFNNPSLKNLISTVVHEQTHVERMLKMQKSLAKYDDLYEEYYAFRRSFLYLNKSRPTLAERNEIWKLVKECYPGYQPSLKPSPGFDARSNLSARQTSTTVNYQTQISQTLFAPKPKGKVIEYDYDLNSLDNDADTNFNPFTNN